MDFWLTWVQTVAVLVVLLWGIGLPAASLLAPRPFRRDTLILAPFLGFGLISGVCHYLGYMGLAVSQFAWPLFAVSIAGILLTLVLRRLRVPARDFRLTWKIGLICLAAYLVALAPLFLLHYWTTIGTTIDGLSYAVRSEYLPRSSARSAGRAAR